MPSTAAHRVHQVFTHNGETASYQIEDGWMRVTWNGARSEPAEVRKSVPEPLAKAMLVQMREWLKKYPEDGVPGKSGD